MNKQTAIETTIRSKRKGGRPKLLTCELRSYQIKVGFTPAQFLVIEARAENAGMPEAELIRRIAINEEIRTMPAVNREALMQLGKIGTNVNQLAKIANSTNSLTFINELKELSAQIKNLGAAIVSSR